LQSNEIRKIKRHILIVIYGTLANLHQRKGKTKIIGEADNQESTERLTEGELTSKAAVILLKVSLF
jgi:hypothetical protein